MSLKDLAKNPVNFKASKIQHFSDFLSQVPVFRLNPYRMGDEDDSNTVGSTFSLVRYDNPVLIDKHSEKPSSIPATKSRPGEDSPQEKARPKSSGLILFLLDKKS